MNGGMRISQRKETDTVLLVKKNGIERLEAC